MVDYKEYNNIRFALTDMIKDKQNMVADLEDKVHSLRKSLRIVDTEFKDKIDNRGQSDVYN